MAKKRKSAATGKPDTSQIQIIFQEVWCGIDGRSSSDTKRSRHTHIWRHLFGMLTSNGNTEEYRCCTPRNDFFTKTKRKSCQNNLSIALGNSSQIGTCLSRGRSFFQTALPLKLCTFGTMDSVHDHYWTCSMTRWEMEAEQRVYRLECEASSPQKSENSSSSAEYPKTDDYIVCCALE